MWQRSQDFTPPAPEAPGAPAGSGLPKNSDLATRRWPAHRQLARRRPMALLVRWHRQPARRRPKGLLVRWRRQLARRSPAALLAGALAATLGSAARLPLSYLWAGPVAGLGALAAAGCGGQVEPDRQTRVGAEAEWAWLVAAKRQLDARRGQLAALGEPAAPQPPAGTATGTTDGNLSPSDRQAREVDSLAQQLGRRLVAYINANPPIEGTPLSSRQLAAIRMKSDEEIVV